MCKKSRKNPKNAKTHYNESFYCNQDDGDYNNNRCDEQCDFCKQAEFLNKNNQLL